MGSRQAGLTEELTFSEWLRPLRYIYLNLIDAEVRPRGLLRWASLFLVLCRGQLTLGGSS